MVESIIVWLIIGAIAGWAAGQIIKGYGFGLVGNIVVGNLCCLELNTLTLAVQPNVDYS